MLPNGGELVAALFGIWRPAASTSRSTRAVGPRSAHVVEPDEPAAIVTAAEALDRMGDRPAVVLATDGPRSRPGTVGTTVRSPASPSLFTSGTTGRPSRCLLHAHGCSDCSTGARHPPGEARRPATEPPMPNLIPVSLSLWAGIYRCSSPPAPARPSSSWTASTPPSSRSSSTSFGIRSTVLPPAAMVMLGRRRRDHDLAPLKYVRSISAPLSPLQARRFRDRFGITVLNGWGQTELGGEVVGWSAADSKALRRRQARRGRPTPRGRRGPRRRATARSWCARRRSRRATPTATISAAG